MSMVAALPWFTLAWLPLLVGLQSIPGTGALRTLALLAGAVHLALWRLRERPTRPWPSAAPAGAIFLVLTAWLALHSLLLAAEPAAASREWFGEWAKLGLMLALGLAVARMHGEARRGALVLALFLGFYLHVVSTWAAQASSLLATRGFAWGQSLLGNYGYASPFTTGAILWLLADAASRLARARPLLPWPSALTLVLAAAAIAAEIWLDAKAGLALAVLLGFLAGIAVATRREVRAAHRGAFLAAVAAALLAMAAGGAPRWEGAIEAVRAGWSDAASSEFWTERMQDPPMPIAAQSFYLRAGWLRAAAEGLAAHPLGLGYGGDAFGRWIARRHGVEGMVSSHSGWLDFALANGVPGLLLLAALLLALARLGWRGFVAGEPAGGALALLSLHLLLRSALDGLLYGSRLTGAALTLAALAYLCANGARAARPG